ncbi:MAG: TVP38/TMEM64 family protein [Deltaproteobacteria bacterium]|nr:TVP38/TMEM64 family protein [Deltaproteobacteria bacterium]MDZ4224963.1 TVP38/TMEM64 family protein [bacterium]
MKKGFLLILFISVVLGLYFFTPVRDYLSKEGFVTLEAWIRSQGVLAPLIFGLIYIIATVFALPGSVLTVSGGILFGTLWGTLINLVSATLGASLAFLLTRYLGREFIEKWTRGKLKRFDQKIGEHGFTTVFYLRLVPIFPFNLLNFSLGLTQIRFRDYFLATLLGMVPGAFVYTSIGGASHYLDLNDPGAWLDYRIWGPFVLVILLSLVPKLFKFLRTRRRIGNGYE